MRYKNLVSDKLEKLTNSLFFLESILRQGGDRQQVQDWLTQTKEKLEEIQTLLNTERQD